MIEKDQVKTGRVGPSTIFTSSYTYLFGRWTRHSSFLCLMNTLIGFTPLNGGSGGSSGYCSLLEFEDNCRVLLDCGTSLSSLAQQMDGIDENKRNKSMKEIEQMLSKLEEIQFGGDTKYDSGEVLQYNISRLIF